ncbi:lyase family protein [Pseudonocardia sp. CA-107938]|uniref:lyase family protein n=1 Tax=Pseudonocardia sp. CA-107938 TaxID=3240021 RepID=UPI003D913FC9
MTTASEPDTATILYGQETRLALRNFPAHGRLLADVPELIRGYAWVKAATARANLELGVLDERRTTAIVTAAAELADGRFDEQFGLPLVQGGGGTSTNMNVNEVLARRATDLLAAQGLGELRVHPNDHVNRSQSSNDSYPTAMALALAQLAQPTLGALATLERSLTAKAVERDGRSRLGRTCLQDAVPLTVGETHRAQAHAVRRTADGLSAAVAAVLAVPLGATAIGTGLGAPDGFPDVAVARLRELSGLDVSVAPDFIDALSNVDQYPALAAAGVRAATVMAKIAADLRILSAPSLLGGAEVTLPRLQAGSSIMPGKVNPVIPELVIQLAHRVRGAALTVDLGAADGELELNVMEPVMLDGLVTILTDLAYAADLLATRAIDGLVWNDDVLDRNLGRSLHGLVEAAADLGYDEATRAASRRTAAPASP